MVTSDADCQLLLASGNQSTKPCCNPAVLRYPLPFFFYSGAQAASDNSGNIMLSAGSTTDGNVGGRFFVRYTSGQDLGVRDVINNNTGEWHHYVGVHINDGIFSDTTLYVDGVGTLATSIVDVTHPFDFTNVGVQHLGLSSGDRYLDGRIGEVRIYDKALTAAQVFQNYNATKETYTGVPASTDPGLTSTRTP